MTTLPAQPPQATTRPTLHRLWQRTRFYLVLLLLMACLVFLQAYALTGMVGG